MTASRQTPALKGDGGLSRAEAIRKGVLAVGLLYGLGAINPQLVEAVAVVGESDVDTFNFLLPFEYLQLTLYERGLEEREVRGQKMPLSAERRELIETLAAAESKHVDALAAMIKKLGGEPAAKGKYAFAFPGSYEYFGLAANLEQSAIDAYNGVIPVIKSSEGQALAASIVQVEGRHAAAVRMQRHEEPAPEALDIARTTLEALDSVEKYTGPAIYESG